LLLKISKFVLQNDSFIHFTVGFHESHFLLSTKPKSNEIFILISSKFRCFDFPKVQCRIRCQTRNSDFGLDFDLLPTTKSKFRLYFVKISTFRFSEILFLTNYAWNLAGFGFWFRFWNRNFDSDIGIPISVTDFYINVDILKHFSPK
jgi:hypothetical protein